METTRWLVRPARSAAGYDGACQLYCFPHAGGGTTLYSSWANDLGPDVQVTAICPPGRERQLPVPPYRTMSTLVADLVAVLSPVVRPPFAFFGHSLGALVAFEVARELWRRGEGPSHLFASASRPPHVPGRVAELCRLDDAALVTELARYGGIPAGLVDEPEVLRIVLPTLRADLGIAAEYVADPGDPLPCPVTALGGRDDDSVDPASLFGWRQQTTGAFERQVLAGGHFYLIPQRDSVLRTIQAVLAKPMTMAIHQPRRFSDD